MVAVASHRLFHLWPYCGETFELFALSVLAASANVRSARPVTRTNPSEDSSQDACEGRWLEMGRGLGTGLEAITALRVSGKLKLVYIHSGDAVGPRRLRKEDSET